MIGRLVLASLRRRFRQLALILAAVTVAAATVAALAGFSARARERLGGELAAFGPNLTVRPEAGGQPALPPRALASIQAVAGVRWARRGQEPGQSAGLTAQGGEGRLIEVRAEAGRLGEVAREIQRRVEGVEAVPLRRVSESDARLSARLTGLLIGVSALALALSLVSVAAATSALLGERRGEIGLLLALGFTARRIGLLYAVELIAAALLAAFAGELGGELAAAGLARRMLGGAGGAGFTWRGAGAAAAAAACVVGAAIALALRQVERLDAARVLKGE